MTVQELAGLLAEELERDSWGDVDPFLFSLIATDDAAGDTDAEGLAEVLGRVLERFAEVGG